MAHQVTSAQTRGVGAARAFAIVLCLALADFARALPSQQQLPIDAIFPFAAVRSVCASAPVLSDPELAILGCGGGLVPLKNVQEEPGQPVVYDPVAGSGNPQGLFLRAGGTVWKIRTLGTQVYAAAGWKGLVRYDRV